jgi:hypothetical protein
MTVVVVDPSSKTLEEGERERKRARERGRVDRAFSKITYRYTKRTVLRS